MAQAISGAGVGDDEAAALGTNVFGVRRVVFPVAKMRAPDRRRLEERLRSELDAVRDLLRKAEQYSGVPGAAGKDDRLSAPGAAVEDDDGCRAAKSRKACPFAERARESKPDNRERLAGRLASMAAALPDHVVAFLQNRRAGDADSRGGDGDGDIEMDDVLSVKDGALFQLKMLLDKFAPETAPKLLLVDKFAPEPSTPKSRGGRQPLAASGISCLSQAQHQQARLAPVLEEEEEGVNISGGVSRIAIRDIAEEYGELVDGVGVQLLSPLQRKYVDLAEEDRYVDICGDASPVVFPAMAKTGDSSSSDSDATYTDSSWSSSSPEVLLAKENSYCRAGEPVPAPEPDPIQGLHNVQPPMPAPEAIHIGEPKIQRAAATVFAVTKSPPAPTVLPQPPEHAPEAVQNAEPEAPGATVHPITGSAPPPAVLSNENGTSSQPEPAPLAVRIAEPQEDEEEQPPLGSQTSHLIALAQEERKRRARAKARQELLKLERAVLPDQRIHPRDMELLGISSFEHVVSTTRDAHTAQPPDRPSILQQLGLFLKADSDGEEEDEMDMDMDMEDGEIL